MLLCFQIGDVKPKYHYDCVDDLSNVFWIENKWVNISRNHCDCIIYQVRSYLQRRCCQNFQGLDMIMIYRFKGIFMLIEDFRNLGPLHTMPEFGKKIREGVGSDTRSITKVIVEDYDELFNRVKTLVEVAACTTTMALAIKEAFPTIKCTVIDLPQITNAREKSDKVEYVAGDMFEDILPADALILKVCSFQLKVFLNILELFILQNFQIKNY